MTWYLKHLLYELSISVITKDREKIKYYLLELLGYLDAEEKDIIYDYFT